MRVEGLMGDSTDPYFPGRSFGLGGAYRSAGYYFFDSSIGETYLRFGSTSNWSFAQNTRVLNQSYACRHLIKVKPPAYRVVGMKSPAHRTSTNVAGRKATQRPARGFLPY
jgi:hypothetical protein